MELKDDEFKDLQSRVEKISAELEKKDVARAVNTKWLITVAAIIMAALGYTNFVQLPAEAAKAAIEKIGPRIVGDAEDAVKNAEKFRDKAKEANEKADKYAEDAKKIVDELTQLKKQIFPKGSIVAWYPGLENKETWWDGKKIKAPDGWAVCDGNNGTPDLRDRFIRGTSSAESIAFSGGKSEHSHEGSTGRPILLDKGSENAVLHGHKGIGGASHRHEFKTEVESNLPPFLYLVYIIKL